MRLHWKGGTPLANMPTLPEHVDESVPSTSHETDVLALLDCLDADISKDTLYLQSGRNVISALWKTEANVY